MATGAYDANGIWQYGEDDNIALFSDLLKLGTESTSSAFTEDRARLATLEAGSLAGLIPVKASSIVVASGTGSVNTLGTVTVSSATAVSFNNIFSSLYKHYRVVITSNSASGSVDFNFRFRKSGIDINSSYYQTGIYTQPSTGSVSLLNSNPGTEHSVSNMGAGVAYPLGATLDIFNAVDATAKIVHSKAMGYSTVFQMRDIVSYRPTSDVYDGFTLFSTGAFNGTFTCYGYNN